MNGDYLTLAEASRAIPGNPSLVTLWRWCHKGVRGGIKLRSLAVGGKRLIPRDAIPEFLAACSAVPNAPAPPRTNRQRATAIKRAEAVLAKAGI